MAYVTEITYTQSGSTNKDFIVTFPFLATTDLRVQLNGTTKSLTSDYTIVQAGGTTTIRFNTAPANSDTIRLHRETDIDAVKSTFQAGSSITASDLNNNYTQFLYASQEFGKLTTTGTSVLTTGNKGDITVNSTTDWVYNADSVEASHMANDAVETAAIKDGAVTAAKIASGALSNISISDGAVTDAKLATNSVTTVKILNANVTEEKLASESVSTLKLKATTTSGLGFNPVGTVIWFAGSSAPTGYLKCNGDAIPNGTGSVQSISSNYSALYAIVGGNIPDLRAEFIRGWDDSRGVDVGRNIRTTQGDQNKSHTHAATSSVNDPGHNHSYSKRTGSQNIDNDEAHHASSTGDVTQNVASNTTGISVNTTNTTEGGNEARPRNIALLACIKY